MTCKHLKLTVCNNPKAQTYKRHVPPRVCAACPVYNGKSRGLGDVVHRVASFLGISRLVKSVERTTGKPCGCSARREALNEKFPNPANESIDGDPK